MREVTPKLPKILKWTLERTEARERQKQFNLLKLKSQKRILEIDSKKKMEDLARKEGENIFIIPWGPNWANSALSKPFQICL